MPCNFTQPYAHDPLLSAIADGLTAAEHPGDVLSAARFRAHLGEKLLLRGQVVAARLHLAAARRVLEAAGRVPDAARASILLEQTLFMPDAPLRQAA